MTDGYIVPAVQEGIGPLAVAPASLVMPVLASYLRQFYTACERRLARVAIAMDGGLPGEVSAHTNLLTQMARELLCACASPRVVLRLERVMHFAYIDAILEV